MPKYLTITHNGEFETIEKKSRFICQMARVTTPEAAQDFINAVKKQHYKANHNVSAFVLGENDDVQRANDDGEPSGTSGVPMLQVLQQMGLKDVVAVTTRYFGGIKLGTGGLIRAYANSVTETVHHLGIVERRLQKELLLHITYSQLGTVQNLLEQADFPVDEIDYTDTVTVHLFVDNDKIDSLKADLIERLNARLTIEEGADSYREVPYIEKSETI